MPADTLERSEISELHGKLSSDFTVVNEQQASLKLSTDVSFVTHFSDKVDDFRSSPAPTGNIEAAADAVSDGSSMRDYQSLFLGPGRLTPTTDDSEHRYLTNPPNFTGTGATLSFWFRARQCDDPTDVCGLFLFTAYEEGAALTTCWSLWLEKERLWFDNPKARLYGQPVAQYPFFGVPERFKLVDEKAWRHVAMVFNEAQDAVEFYLDGSFVVREIWGSPVAGASCLGPRPRIAFGRKAPGFTYGGTVEVFDLRMYVHGAKGPLGAAEIRNISQGETPALAAAYKCVTSGDPGLEEREWRDKDGHDCSWYQANKPSFPMLCEAKEAAENCPISCASRQECWNGQAQQSVNAYYTWQGVQRVEPGLTSPSGSLCLHDETTIEAAEQQCEEWQRGGPPESDAFTAWLESFRTDVGTESRRGNRLDLRDCAQLARAYRAECTINASAVREFTRESQANNGDFTLFWWMRPLGKASENAFSNSFIPHVQFLSSVSPPSHNLAVGLWANSNGEARFFSACPEGKFDNIELQAADSEGWTFFAISRKSRQGAEVGEGVTLTNVGKNWEGSAWQGRQCLFNSEAFFAALEVNYGALMSPITMVPAYMPVSTLQRTYQGMLEEVRNKIGASSQAEAEAVHVDKNIFSQPMILIVPPIVFQTRAQPAPRCPSRFTQELIETHFEALLRTTCAPPFACDPHLTRAAGGLLSCAGAPVEDPAATEFGLSPEGFRGDMGFADFLASFTEPVFVLRDGRLYETKEFVDTLTQTVQVYLVFWNPEASITTVLTVSADFSEVAAAIVDVSVEHYELLEGQGLLWYIVVQCMVLVNVLLMLSDIFINLKNTLRGVLQARRLEVEEALATARQKAEQLRSKERKGSTVEAVDEDPAAKSNDGGGGGGGGRRAGPSLSLVVSVMHGLLLSVGELLKDFVDIVIATLVVVYVVMRIPSRQASRGETEDTVGRLSRIDWGSTDLKREAKVEEFIVGMDRLTTTLGQEAFFNQFCNVVLILSLLRLIKCTGMHPRLALLERSLSKAWDDLWHTTIIIILLMFCFAGIGSWRFGGYREDFATIEEACQTLFIMTFGEFPDDWNETGDLQLFTVLYFMLVFLMVQNFLLAVIVESYMAVRKDNEEMETEQEFLLDIFTSFQAQWMAYARGWPTPHQMGSVLEEWQARFSVGFEDLWRTGLFKTRKGVVDFMRHYRAYDFCEPIQFDRYGPDNRDEQEKLKHDLEIRLAGALGHKIQTLREFAEENLRIAAERREHRHRHSDSEPEPVDAPKVNGFLDAAERMRACTEPDGAATVHRAGGIDALAGPTPRERALEEQAAAREVHLSRRRPSVAEELFSRLWNGGSKGGGAERGGLEERVAELEERLAAEAAARQAVEATLEAERAEAHLGMQRMIAKVQRHGQHRDGQIGAGAAAPADEAAGSEPTAEAESPATQPATPQPEEGPPTARTFVC